MATTRATRDLPTMKTIRVAIVRGIKSRRQDAPVQDDGGDVAGQKVYWELSQSRDEAADGSPSPRWST